MENFKYLKKIISTSKNILITTHDYPDADGIGSQLALAEALKGLKKNVHCVNEEALIERFSFLHTHKSIISFEKFAKKKRVKVDYVIIVDTHNYLRCGKKIVDYLQKLDAPIFYIDHHPCREEVQKHHLIDNTAAATGELVAKIISKLKIEFTRSMAIALYTAIVIDTSSFRYPTVTGETHRIIAKLLETGITPHQVYNQLYAKKGIAHMHLLGKVLQSANVNRRNDFAWITFNSKDLKEFDSEVEDTHSFINNLLVLDGIKVACSFRIDKETIKISFRSIGVYDVGMLATYLGGGGHSHSAATVIPLQKKAPYRLIDEMIRTIDFFIKNYKLG
ncbi:bifunctional oligoribonuclease/PAP phosphatase NrnA [Bacteriovoracaceae bacterium]|nr:bifunctional oligoribonuclease/PAP phosphatase NrnA [Bacteriovoracaceae bacterium]